MMEASTLQWPRLKENGGDQTSVRTDCASASWTEKELKAGGGQEEEELKKQGEHGGNNLPEKAAKVFSPTATVLHSPPSQSDAFWEVESEKSPFHGFPAPRCGCGCPSRDLLKLVVSLVTSVILFPFLVWGGFVFLPFDAPLLDGAPFRLVYTLHSSVFATIPIVLGWLVLGVRRLRLDVVRPLFDEEFREADCWEVNLHRRFVTDSTSLFVMYFLQLVVMAMYLSQEQLKLVPLLTVIFALGRLVYWAAAAFGSSIRAFGFGMSFLPSVTMIVANVCFIFTVETSGSVFELQMPPSGKQRFWG
ncbi:transmembrane protein 79-like [Thalassophryne amazonica]|uniref:transmembrane protein 79-like n=1 Tax=Thalassophryne amazonica TaxID=390379 RepID=UPI001471520F|nr:transmembrane protein 79-like [Thalassophryne amazonica]